MHAVVIRDGELHWEERPDPMPGDTELLVAVRGAGVNAADLHQRRGVYPAPPGVPADIPGLELAGEVVAVGARVTRVSVGARIMAVVGGGAQAELAVVDEAVAVPVPETVEWPAAGGFPEAFTTAYDALVGQCGLAVGDRVLVTGAAGGVGTAAVQLAATAGALTIASTRHGAHRDALLGLGANEVVDPEGVSQRGPFDIVVELVGAASLATALDALAVGGRVAVIGMGGGATLDLSLLTLMQRRARIGGSTMRARSLEEKASLAAAMARHVVPLMAAGRVRVPVAETFALREATAAYERFAAGGKLGKLVLVPG
jgi:NADPH:quinone reductase